MSYLRKNAMGKKSLDIQIDVFYRGADNIRRFDEVISDPRKKEHDHLHVVTTNNFKKYIDTSILDPSTRGQSERYVVNGIPFTLLAAMDIKKNTIYGGSIKAWEEFLCQMYILCRKDATTEPLISAIKQAYEDCFNKPISSAPFLTRANYSTTNVNDIEMSDELASHDKIIDLIKKYKREFESTDIEIEDIVRIANRSIFDPIINASNTDSKEDVMQLVSSMRSELVDILSKIETSGIDKPKIYQNTFDNIFHETLILSLTILDKKDKNEYTVEEIFNKFKEFDSSRLDLFINKFIGDESGTGDTAAEDTFKILLKEYLDKLAINNDIIKKKNANHYSVIGVQDKVVASLKGLSAMLPALEKRALAIEILKYIRG